MTADVGSLCRLTDDRQLAWKARFAQCARAEDILKLLMEVGKEAPQLPREQWRPQQRVLGCQSEMYLDVQLKEGRLELRVGSDALISSGLAALLVSTYQHCTPEQCLRCPFFLPEQIGLPGLLTPGRLNGLDSLIRTLRAKALQTLLEDSASGA
jgi:cysteine desulfuration protein SufE